MQEFFQGILAILGCSADCIEKAEVRVHAFRAKFLLDRGTNPALNLLGLATEHGGLVRYADRLEMQIRIEPFRVGALEFFEKLMLVASLHDVIADIIRLREGEDHESKWRRPKIPCVWIDGGALHGPTIGASPSRGKTKTRANYSRDIRTASPRNDVRAQARVIASSAQAVASPANKWTPDPTAEARRGGAATKERRL